MRAYVAWMILAGMVVAFIIMAREGPIHDAAWADLCYDLRHGGAIEASMAEPPMNIVNHCKDFDPRRAR